MRSLEQGTDMTDDTEATTDPRKHPQQTRSKKTVDRILRAAETYLIEHGSETLSTNKIADAAGVNISSLYQYFPNKESILSALAENYLQRSTDALKTQMDAMIDEPMDVVARAWLKTGIEQYRRSESIFPEFVKNHFSVSPLPGTYEMENRLLETGRKFTMRRRDLIEVEDLNVALYVAFNAAMLVLSKHLISPNGYLSDDEVIEGIVTMICRYMQPSLDLQSQSG